MRHLVFSTIKLSKTGSIVSRNLEYRYS